MNFALFFALLFSGFAANAQVDFKLSYDYATEQYTVSVIPVATYTQPQNITGTGQVTIKVPTNDFDPVDIKNHLQGMFWEANSRNNSPSEAPSFDYVSFGLSILSGVAYPDYVAGEEMPLFSFKNAYGCTGQVYIIDNNEDPFMPPNSQSANIGNALTILGAGGDAYQGVLNGGITDCDPQSPTSTAEELGLNGFSIFPNPATDFVKVQIKWEGETTDADLQVVNAAGKLVHVQSVTVQNGRTNAEIIVSNFAAGSYFVYLASEDWKIGLDKFTKQ